MPFPFFMRIKTLCRLLRKKQKTNPEAEEGCYRVDKQQATVKGTRYPQSESHKMTSSALFVPTE